MKHYDLKDYETDLINKALEYYLHNARMKETEVQEVNHLILKIEGRGMSFEAIKQVMDEQCLKTLNDSVDSEPLKKGIQENFYDKGMGISCVVPIKVVEHEGRKGQVFRFELFYNEAYGANKGCLCPQDMPYHEMVVWGENK